MATGEIFFSFLHIFLHALYGKIIGHYSLRYFSNPRLHKIYSFFTAFCFRKKSLKRYILLKNLEEEK